MNGIELKIHPILFGVKGCFIIESGQINKFLTEQIIILTEKLFYFSNINKKSLLSTLAGIV
jgi:hypothetical protein